MAAVLDAIGEFERDDDAVHWRWVAAESPMHRASRHRRGQPEPVSAEDAPGNTSLGQTEIRERTLILSVNSRERADRGQDLLPSRLGHLAGPSPIAHQTPERAVEERAGRVPDEPDIPPEEAGAGHVLVPRRPLPAHPRRSASHARRQDAARGGKHPYAPDARG